MNTSIFGQNGASSRLRRLTAKGLDFVQETSPAEIGGALSHFLAGGPRTLISSINS